MEALETVWEKGLATGELRFPQCDHCDTWNWYPLPACRCCGKTAFTWQQVELKGSLYSWTRVYRNFSGHDVGELPYIVGIIDIEGAPGVRIPCRYVGSEDGDPQVGAKVTLTPLLLTADSNEKFGSESCWGFNVC
jgi:uncharacterized protein